MIPETYTRKMAPVSGTSLLIAKLQLQEISLADENRPKYAITAACFIAVTNN